MSKREAHPDQQVNPEVLQDQWLKEVLSFNPAELRSARLRSGLAEPQFSFLTQVEARIKYAKKFTTLVTEPWIFPTGLALEQSSSCTAAKFKSSLISTRATVDLCAGMGIDSWALCSRSKSHLAFERNKPLAQLLEFNLPNAHVVNNEFNLADLDIWISANKINKDELTIYLDPDRRVTGTPSFSIHDTVPNLPSIQEDLLSRASTILAKHSPMSSIEELRALEKLQRIYIMQDKGECKEILTLQRTGDGDGSLTLVELDGGQELEELATDLEVQTTTTFGAVIIQPSPGLSKSGLHTQLANSLNWSKLPFGSLYTSEMRPPQSPFYKTYMVQEISNGFKFKKKDVSAAVEAIGTPFTTAAFRSKHKIKEGDQHKIFVLQLGKTKHIVSTLKME